MRVSEWVRVSEIRVSESKRESEVTAAWPQPTPYTYATMRQDDQERRNVRMTHVVIAKPAL